MVVAERASHWDYFNQLGSFDEQKKFRYAVKLYVLFTDDRSEDSTRDYILSRIVAALGALSDNLRAGAFSLLCLILSKNADRCDFEAVNKLIDNHLKPTGTGKADAEAYVGLLLAYKALIQSGYLDKHPDRYTSVAAALMELSTQKSYLHGECLSLLGQITTRSREEYGDESFVRHLKDLNVASLDKLHYLLKLATSLENSEILATVFDGKSLLDVDNATEIGIVLAKCHNLKHVFVSEFLDAVAGNPKYVSAMWKSYENQIRGRLNNSTKAALEMYYTFLTDLLKKMQQKQCFKAVNKIVTETVVETLLKNSKAKPELTKDACKAILDILVAANDSALSVKILEKLVFKPGDFSFDEETGSRLVGAISANLGKEEMKSFGDKCLETAVNGNGAKNKDRLNALNLYCSLLNKTATSVENQWRLNGMKTLLEAGLVNRENLGYELATIIRKSFFNTLSTKFSSLQAYAEALKELSKTMNSLLNKQKSLRIKITDEMKDAWKLWQKLIKNLEKKAKTEKEGNAIVVQALVLLSSFVALKSINEPKESQLNLKDIDAVFNRISSADSNVDGPEWIEVLMDLFLNMLSKPNVSNRTVINIVFKTIVPHLNDRAFDQLVNVLNPEVNLNETVEEPDEKAMSEDGDDVSDDDSSDAQDEKEGDDAEEDEESDEESDDDEEEVDSAFNQEKLQFELRKALMPGEESDNESINIDDLDEEQGRQLDATLSAIFKSNLTKKKSPKREDITSHFRTRVLDLLETYALTGMPLDHWCLMIPMLLKLANHTIAAKNAGGLKQRLLSLVRRISSVKISDIASDSCQISSLVSLLEYLTKQASTASGTALDLRQHYLELIKFCIRNINFAQENDKNDVKESSTAIVSSAVENFFLEKNSLQLELLTFFCQHKWCGVHDVARKLVDFTFDPATKPYKRVQGTNLLASYLKSDRTFASLTETEAKAVKKITSSLLGAMVNLKTEKGQIDMKTQHLIAQLVINLNNGKASSYVKWKKWKETLPQVLSVPEDKKYKQTFAAMCKKLDMKVEAFAETDTTEKVTSSEEKTAEEKSPKKDRKRKGVDARKLKKESKRLRLAAMDDGLENPSWSKLAMDE
ncbi:DNA polymerase phi [Nesidiocoris tenuis]|uniref:DNA polymerase phi n=1 Tax=Nesidiocoris tenuis TaxID=355587 RepID=A0ABN7ARS3_9HEMI|nr:DNA polymerase phi [Nesidiocoris tenuis]